MGLFALLQVRSWALHPQLSVGDKKWNFSVTYLLPFLCHKPEISHQVLFFRVSVFLRKADYPLLYFGLFQEWILKLPIALLIRELVSSFLLFFISSFLRHHTHII